jgi:hypothetical protein
MCEPPCQARVLQSIGEAPEQKELHAEAIAQVNLQGKITCVIAWPHREPGIQPSARQLRGGSEQLQVMVGFGAQEGELGEFDAPLTRVAERQSLVTAFDDAAVVLPLHAALAWMKSARACWVSAIGQPR